jgi:hypothetical protein
MAVQRTASTASVHAVSDDAQAPVREPEPLSVVASSPVDGPVDGPVDPTIDETAVEPAAPPPPSEPAVDHAADHAVDHKVFDLHETGQIHGDGAKARHTAEAMLYIARVSEAMGLHMGAGTLESIELFGAESAYTVVTTEADGSLSVAGCLSLEGAPPEQLREWHRTRSKP